MNLIGFTRVIIMMLLCSHLFEHDCFAAENDTLKNKTINEALYNSVDSTVTIAIVPADSIYKDLVLFNSPKLDSIFGDSAPKKVRNIHVDIIYPQIAKENDIEGKVTVSFVVTKDGKIENIKLEKGIGYKCDEEAIKAVKKIPNFTSSSVTVKYYLTINFELR